MPNFERNLRQICTYWDVTGEKDMFGKSVFTAPVELPCRWEDINELFIAKNGQEVTSRSRVFLAQDISLEGYLMLGISVDPNPLNLSTAFEVRQVKAIPDLRSLKKLFTVYL